MENLLHQKHSMCSVA